MFKVRVALVLLVALLAGCSVSTEVGERSRPAAPVDVQVESEPATIPDPAPIEVSESEPETAAGASSNFAPSCVALTQSLSLTNIPTAEFDIDPVELTGLVRSLDAGPGTIIFLEPDATQREIDAFGELFEITPGVTIIEFFDQQRSFEEFQATFADEERIRDSVTVADMPTSYRLVEGPNESAEFDAFVDQLRVDPWVLDVVQRPGVPDTIDASGITLYELLVTRWLRARLIVFMNPGASDEEIEAVRAFLDDGRHAYRWFDRAESFAEFTELFPDDPLDEADIPPSFRIEQAGRVRLNELDEVVREFAGVFETSDFIGNREPLENAVLSTLLQQPDAERAMLDVAAGPTGLADLVVELGAGLTSELTDQPGEMYVLADELRDVVAEECGWELCICKRVDRITRITQALAGFEN